MTTSISPASARTDAARTEPIPKKSVQIRTDKPRPHLCAICTRGFARLEHLKRHERAHTNEKPYQCAACGRCFARRDLVLRHQQKLHTEIFQVARRGSLPVVLGEDHASPGVSESHVIILRNNTQAKAPLPAQREMFKGVGTEHDFQSSGGFGASTGSSPGHDSTNGLYAGPQISDEISPRQAPDSVSEHIENVGRPESRIDPSFLAAEFGPTGAHPAPETGPHDIRFNSHSHPAKGNGPIPSPNTNSYHNTPSGSGHMQAHTAPNFSDLAMLQTHAMSNTDYTQQPSPLTGDSPEGKDPAKIRAEKARQAFLNDQLEFKSSLDLKNFASVNKVHSGNTRHASFSAVPGLSYTNLQDALAIRTTQNGQGQGRGRGGPSNDVGAYIQDANIFTPVGGTGSAGDIDGDLSSLQVPGFASGDLDWYSMHFGDSKSGLSQGSRNGAVNGENADPLATGAFKTSLDTIPSVSHLANAFLNTASSENGHILAGHQFQDPSHPHHIPGTTPMAFGLAMEDPFGGSAGGLAALGASAGENTAINGIGTRTTPGPSGSEASPTAAKRRKLGFVNDTADLEWLEEFKGIPVQETLPLASTSTGFLGMPFVTEEFQSDDVFSLFKLKQDDLVRQKSMVDVSAAKKPPMDGLQSHEQTSRRTSRAQFSIGEPEPEPEPEIKTSNLEKSSEFISDELRAKIVASSAVDDAHFPPKHDLNAYMQLYGDEFNTYFPFIHVPTLRNPMVDNLENIPMILAMCAIGALYSYHDSNTLLLFNLSKFHIHRFFETEVTPAKLQRKKVPIMAHQCLVLHIFISMFLNEPNMVDITSRQMHSMVGLIRSTNFHRPLELFLQPPPVANPAHQATLQDNYGYFIMAQTRIRTILTFYQLEVVRSILLGCPLPLSGTEIASGIHCSNEKMWRAENAQEWYESYSAGDENSIVDASNNQTLGVLADQLHGAPFADGKSTFAKSLALLMYVHEQISASHNEMAKTASFEPFSWRVSHRPRLEHLIDSWEEYFVRNGGSIIINSENQQLLTSNAELKMILPLSLLVRIRLSVNISPVTAAVLHRDWSAMASHLTNLDEDIEGLREASKYAFGVLELWIHNISVVNDAKQTSVRTPLYFLTAVFIAVVILGKNLDSIENGKTLTVSERAFWLQSEKVLRSIETTLSAHEQSSYSDFLDRQAGGIFGFDHGDGFHQNVQAVLAQDKTMKVKSVKKCRLSTRALGLGVRVLADAPLWPLAMRFADALKHMAMEINGKS